MGKGKIQSKLEALDKNQRSAQLGLQRVPLEARLDGKSFSLELVYLHLPAQNPDPSALPVVLVHGTPGTLFTWDNVIFGTPEQEGLARRRDVYAIEVIGHGMAPGSAAPYTFQRCADFVGQAIAALGLDKAYVVGNSYGAEFVWRAALDDPDRFAGIALMHPSGYARADEEWLPEEVVMRENRLAKIGWLLNSKKRVLRALEPHFRGVPAERDDEIFLVCENAHNWKAMIDLVRDENGSRAHELSNLQTPTLLLWGAQEIAYPLETIGKRFASDLPNAELVAIDRCGHYPQEERPAEVIRALAAFFEQLDKSP